MVSIVMHKKRNLVVPKLLVKGDRLLRLCVRCRNKKTRCDAAATRPNPCSYCAKKNLVCVLDVTHPLKRPHDLTERLVCDVQDLHHRLDLLVSRKARLVQQFLNKRTNVASTPATPPVLQIQSILNSPEQPPTDPASIYIDPIPTLCLSESFTIHTNQTSVPWTLSYDRAKELYVNFEDNFSSHLPVLPRSFFLKNLHTIHSESDLLFWTIIVTSLLSKGTSEEYFQLAVHVQNLVVVNCWFNTPRSLYAVVALLILTTWPLPDDRSSKIQDSISVKYISLMKNLSLQFGLHKLNFIDEFSKKTNMEVAEEDEVNKVIRERIYKFVTINANYWLVYLGLSNSNYNGFHQDYIINRAANIDIFKKDDFPETENFINSLLKVSLVQLRMNESMINLVENPSKISKLIHLNMFENILSDYSKNDSPLLENPLIELSLEYSKLQLYVYYFSQVDITLDEYKNVISRTVRCCQRILDLFETLFGSVGNFYQVPIHFRFSIELAALTLLDIHSCLLLNTVDDYLHVKQLFLRSFKILTTFDSSQWSQLSKKFFKIIDKYDSCDTAKLLTVKSQNNSFFLINKMTNYLVSGLHYEMIWQIYLTEKLTTEVSLEDIDWSRFGLNRNNSQHQKIIDYKSKSGSIFS